jgi:hypothetical protein
MPVGNSPSACSDFNFTSAEAALQYFSGANQVTFGIRSDASGLPGTLLQTFVATNIPSVSPGSIVLFNATARLVLSAGSTYWLTSEQYSPDDTQVSWRFNNQGSAGLSIRISTGAWVNGSQPTPAFRIMGRVWMLRQFRSPQACRCSRLAPPACSSTAGDGTEDCLKESIDSGPPGFVGAE